MNLEERAGAERELGAGFNPDAFDMESCNRNLGAGLPPDNFNVENRIINDEK
jgi:hypothetical protein